MFFYIGFFRFEGARVPHRLCIKAVHPSKEGASPVFIGDVAPVHPKIE